MCGVGDAGGFDDAETVIAGRGEPAPRCGCRSGSRRRPRGKEAPAKDRCASAAACTASRARRKVKKSASPWRSTWCPPRPPNASASSRSCSARSSGYRPPSRRYEGGRSLDVREQEGDRSGRCMYRYRGGSPEDLELELRSGDGGEAEGGPSCPVGAELGVASTSRMPSGWRSPPAVASRGWCHPVVSTIPVSTSMRQSSERRNGFPRVSSCSPCAIFPISPPPSPAAAVTKAPTSDSVSPVRSIQATPSDRRSSASVSTSPRTPLLRCRGTSRARGRGRRSAPGPGAGGA